jgi:ATP-dependent Clp protease ATP-binding subunit ClpA
MMWQLFTERARRAVFHAQEEAQKFGEGHVTTEHLLLGLVRDEDSVAARVLGELGMSLQRVREEVEKQLPRAERKSVQEMTLTPRVKRVIDLAYDEARSLNNNYVGTEHLLLGLMLEGEGLAGRVLAKLGATAEAARRVVLSLQEERASEPSPQRILVAIERALVRLATAFALGDEVLTREAARDLRAAGGNERQVAELSDMVSSSAKQDVSHLVEICLQIMRERPL